MQKLFSQEEMASIVLEASPSGMVMVNSRGEILLANKQIEKIFGYQRGEIIGKNVDVLVPEEFRVFHPDQREQYYLNPEPRQMGTGRELFGLRKDGSRVPVEVGLTPIQTNGEIFVVSSIVDISERRKMLQELEKQDELLHYAFEETNDGWWDWNLEDKFLYISPRFWQVLGRDSLESQDVLKQWKELIHPDDLIGVIELYREHCESRGEVPFILEARVKHIQGNWITVICHGKVVDWTQQGLPLRMVGTHTDISSQKKISRELEDRKQELEKSNAALEEFAYVVSHDLQAPLRHIMGHVHFLKEDLPEDLFNEDLNESIKFITQGAEKMKSLLTDLLTYSRVGIDSNDLKRVDLNELLKEVCEVFSSDLSKKNITFTTDNLPIVKAYKSKLFQLFQNLIGNAIKYRKKEGDCLIELKVVDAEDMWKFTIKDNGIGIDPIFERDIFRVFHRINVDSKGTGVGLSICKKITEIHGGKIWVESELGKGSTFHFTLSKKIDMINRHGESEELQKH
ncbi:MAG: PAS domain S-box protein [Halobacteriovoraceae bacterium]|nr:PAS domain S-box protein [Halobacteriovoraceae bacterium]